MNPDFDPSQAEVFPNPDLLDAPPASDPNSRMIYNRRRSVDACALMCLIAWAVSVPVLADVVINEIHYDPAIAWTYLIRRHGHRAR